MKRAISLLLMVVTLSIPGLARNRNSAALHFSSSTRVGPKEIPQGDYKMMWVGSGPEVQVIFSQGKKEIVTVPAKVVQAQNDWIAVNTADGVSINTAQEGNTTILEEIVLPHLKFSFDHDVKTGQ